MLFRSHVRAILGVEVAEVETLGPSASCAVVVEGDSNDIRYQGLAQTLASPQTDFRIFGKPEVRGKRRLAVALARANDVEEARSKARSGAATLNVTCR